MICPFCGNPETKVVETRRGDEPATIRRRRLCQTCQRRFTTFEKPELSLPLVVKKNGSREPFKSEKILAGIKKACEKRPVKAEDMERIVRKVERIAAESGEKEIPSILVGRIVIDELKKLDKVAYVRFASVYKEFKDISEFLQELQTLIKEGEKMARRR